LGNYLEMLIIRCFNGLMSNFLENSCKSFEAQLELELT